MPPPASNLQSGLRTMQRDWSRTSSQTSLHRTSSQSEEIDWPLTQVIEKAPQRELTPHEKRMRAIEEGLRMARQSQPSSTTPSQPSQAATALKTSSVVNTGARTQYAQPAKRPSSEGLDLEPAKKKRVLPDSWADAKTQQIPSGSRSSTASSSVTTLSYGLAPPSSKSNAVAKVFLSAEQQAILKLVQEGQNVFYTGSAGTGKSVLMREIITCLKNKYKKHPDAIAITASTGIAACNIGGVTLHSFAGVGVGDGSAEQLITKVRKNKKAVTRWLRTKVLIIDEVSMVDGDLFDKISRVGSSIHKTTRPFGGLQIIVTGDFFQLPPVTKSGQPKFAFEAQLWPETISKCYNLTKVFRQTDQEFVDMLNEMRFGRLSDQSIQKFKSLSRPINYADGMMPTELFPRREDVERSNSTRMKDLTGPAQVYVASDGGSIRDEAQREKMLQNFMAPKQLEIKVDSQVMLIKNTDESLVNGSMGRVVRFSDSSEMQDTTGDEKGTKKKQNGASPKYPVVEFQLPDGRLREVLVTPDSWKVELPDGEIQVSRTQLPLILAWAMSIHKSQGQTLQRVKVDLGRVFEKGQAYVALSRATSLDGLQILKFDASKVQAHPKVIQWSKTLQTIQC